MERESGKKQNEELRCKKQIISISRISNNPKEKRGKQNERERE
jgi:hypothetical protein